ncbi:hypothetical protein Tco_1111277 [Tanacetum coccineum]|uniref:Uncharacterized protein n=1 Tax=Tanacetum coccineum TaxID=301880 RepID=A0ABQ5IL55_9ASTR
MSIQDMEDLKQQYLNEMKSLINEFPIKDYRDEKIDIKINELKENFNGMSIEINKKKKLQQLEQVANLSTYPSRLFNSFYYDDDDDDDEDDTIAITTRVENLVPIPSESEDFSDIKKIISTKKDPHHFNAESDLIESLLNRDILIVFSPKFDSLLEEFSGELTHIDFISSRINETDFDPEEEIRLVEKLLYNNSSPRPPKEFNSENSDAIIESFSPHLLSPNDSPSLLENESFHFDVPSSPRPPAKPPDDDEIEPDTGLLNAKVVGLPRDFEASRARGFVLRSLELQSLA